MSHGSTTGVQHTAQNLVCVCFGGGTLSKLRKTTFLTIFCCESSLGAFMKVVDMDFRFQLIWFDLN